MAGSARTAVSEVHAPAGDRAVRVIMVPAATAVDGTRSESC